jgi:hypothetical protein
VKAISPGEDSASSMIARARLSRRFCDVTLPLAIAFLMISLSLNQAAAEKAHRFASPSGFTPLSGGATDKYTMDIFGALGQIWINNSGTVGDHDVLNLYPKVAYQIYALLPAGFQFMEWEASSATLGATDVNHTTFTTGFSGSIGALVLVPYAKTGPSFWAPWAGYLGDGSGITQVGGQFSIPTSLTHEGSGTDTLGIWVGMGGYDYLGNSSPPLFQLGIWLNLSSSGTVTVSIWWFYIFVTAQKYLDCTLDGYFTGSGPTTGSMYVDLGHNSTGLWGYVQSTSTYQIWRVWGIHNGCPESIYSTYTSADWIVENPTCGLLCWGPAEAFNSAITFSVLSYTNHSVVYQPSAGQFVAPLLAQEGCVPSGGGYLDWWPNQIGGSFTEDSNQVNGC